MGRIRAFWVVGLVLFGSSLVAAAEWRVGIARTDITPAEPVWMAGYAARNHPAEGTLHTLWAKALVIEDERGGRAVSTRRRGPPGGVDQEADGAHKAGRALNGKRTLAKVQLEDTHKQH